MGKKDDQSWYWTPEWQAAEREADEDIVAGRVKEFDSMDEMLADIAAYDEAVASGEEITPFQPGAKEQQATGE